MASVGQITASLVAQTSRFSRPLQAAQTQLQSFQKRADDVKKRLDRVAQAGKGAGVALASLTGSIGLLVRNAVQSADAFDTMAKQIGLTVEQAQALSFVAQRSNADMAILQTALRGFARRSAEAARGNESFAKEFRRLGVSVTDAHGNLRDVYDLFFEVADAVSELGSEAEASASLMNLMSDAGRKLVPLMRQGGTAIRGFVDQAERMGLVISQEQIDTINAFQDEMDILRAQFRAAGMTLAATFIPVLQVVIGWVQQGVQWFQNLSDESRQQIVMWAALTAGILGAVVVFAVVAKAISGVISVVQTLGVIIAAVMSPIGIAILKVIAIIALLAGAATALKWAWDNNWLGIREAVENAWEKISPIIDSIIEWGNRVIETAWNWVVEAAGNLWQWGLDNVAPWIDEAISTAWDWTIDAAGSLWQWGLDKAFPWLGNVASTAWNWTIDALGPFWEWIRDKLFPFLSQIAKTQWHWTFRVFGMFWDFLSDQLWPFIFGLAQTTWEWTFKAFGALWDWLTGPAANWIGGIAETTWNFVQGLIPEPIKTAMKSWGEVMSTTFNLIASGDIDLIEVTEQMFEKFKDGLKSVWEFTVRGIEPLLDLVKSIASLPGKALDWLVGGARNVGQSVLGFFGLQRGGILPGTGGPDQFPALLAPGEAVIPHRVWQQGIFAIADWFKRMGAPGFQAGGIAGAPSGATGAAANSLPAMLINGIRAVIDTLLSVVAFMADTWGAEGLAETLQSVREQLDVFADALTGASKRAEDAPITPDPEKQLTLWQRVINYVGNLWQQGIAFMKEQAELAGEQLKAFGTDILASIGPLGLVSSFLSELAGPVQTLIFPLTMVASVLANALLPVFKETFPIIKFFAQILLTVAQVIGAVWNALIDLVSLIPFVNFRNLKIDLDSLSTASQELAKLTWEEAEARANNTQELNNATQALRNVPQVFRMALRTGQAAGVTALQTGGIVQRPTFAMLGEAGPEAVIPLDRFDGGRGDVVINVNMNGPIFGMRDFENRIQEALSRAMRRAGLSEYGVVVKWT